jgi:hypothetical protein
VAPNLKAKETLKLKTPLTSKSTGVPVYAGAGARRALLVTRASAAAAPETTSRGLQGPVVSIVLPKHIFFGSVVKVGVREGQAALQTDSCMEI